MTLRDLARASEHPGVILRVRDACAQNPRMTHEQAKRVAANQLGYRYDFDLNEGKQVKTSVPMHAECGARTVITSLIR
jgi:hypothetical protein